MLVALTLEEGRQIEEAGPRDDISASQCLEKAGVRATTRAFSRHTQDARP